MCFITVLCKYNSDAFYTGVSGERIWVEMKKIVTGRMAAEIVEKMIHLGLGPHIGMSETK